MGYLNLSRDGTLRLCLLAFDANNLPLFGIVCFGNDSVSSPCWHCRLWLGKVGGRRIQIVPSSWNEQSHGHALDEYVLDYGKCNIPLWIYCMTLSVDICCNIVLIFSLGNVEVPLLIRLRQVSEFASSSKKIALA
jgi:hypothetical protein